MLRDLVENFQIFGKLFTREEVIWIIIDGVLSLILIGANCMGVPHSYVKKTGKDKWTKFKYH